MTHRILLVTTAAVGLALTVPTATATARVLPVQASAVAELVRQGDFWVQRGRRDLADQAYRRALQIDPGNASALRGLRGGQAAPAAPAPRATAPAPRAPAVRAPTVQRAPARASTADRGAARRASGFQALERGDLAAAASHFEAALAARAGDREAAGGLGLVRLRQGEFVQARDLLTRASAGGDDAQWAEALTSARFYAGLQTAEASADAGDVASAETALNALIQSSTGEQRAQASGRLAGLLADQGRYDEATRLFDAAASGVTDPAQVSDNQRRALQAGAAAAAARGDVGAAETLYRQALDTGGAQDIWLRYAFAAFLVDQGRSSDAAAIALPLENGGPQGLYAAALLYNRAGRAGDAARVLRRIPPAARTAEIQALEAEIGLADVEVRARRLAESGRTAEAVAVLDQARSQATTAGGLVRLGTAYADIGAIGPAANLARDAATRPSPGDAEAEQALVALLARTDQDDAAMNLIRRTTGGDAANPLARRLYVTLAVASANRMLAAGQQAEAFEVLRSAWDIAPDDPDILVALGQLYASGELNTEAGQVFEMALARRADDPVALQGLSSAASAAGDHDAARRAAARRLQLQPASADAYIAAARVEEAAGDRRAARRLLEQAVVLEGGSSQLQRGSAFSVSNPFRTMASAAPVAPNPFAPETLRGVGSRGGPEAAAAPASPARAALAALTIDTAPRAEGYVAFGTRSGEAGLSNLDSVSASASASTAFAGGRISVTAAPTVIDSGSPSLSGTARFGTNATAEALAIVAQQPARLTAVDTQYESGVALSLGYVSETVQADVGSTPLGFLETDIQGGLSWRPRLGDHGVMRLFVERRPVQESILSYAGAVDPVTGRTWGGVMRSGGGVGFSYDRNGTGVYADAAYRAYRGLRVAQNNGVEVNLGGYGRVYDSGGLQVTAGAAVNYQAFDENLGYFTLGHGGYFSPQSFVSLSLPIRADWRGGAWRISAQATPGVQSYHQDSADVYPTRPALQAQLDALKAQNPDVRASYDSASSSGLAFAGKAEAWYDLSSSTAIGGDLSMTTFGDFDEYMMTLRLKQTFGARP